MVHRPRSCQGIEIQTHPFVPFSFRGFGFPKIDQVLPFPLTSSGSGPAVLAEPAGPGVQQSNFLAQDLLTLRFPIDKPYRGIASLPQTVEGFAANITAIFDQQFFWNCSVNLDRTRATIS
jgi:hypothetical protein